MAVIQSLVRGGVVDDCVAQYGHLIVDECHHISARSFEEVVRRAKARYVLGLSATVARKDGHHPVVFMQCGAVRHVVDAKAQAAARPFRHVVLVRPTSFSPLRPADPDLRVQFQSLYGELMADDRRNRLICDDVVETVREGRSPLVLTERDEHLDDLASRLAPAVGNLVVLRGGAGRKETRGIAARLASIADGEERVLLATGRYIGEGFDDARLDTLFLALPVSWRGTVAQYAGRLHRLHDRKREVRVYDYADLGVPMLARMFDRRCRGYEAVGYSILLPASARARLARRRSTARRSAVEERLCGQRCAVGPRRRRCAAGEPLRARGAGTGGGGRGHRPGPQRHRGVSLSAARNPGSDPRAIPAELPCFPLLLTAAGQMEVDLLREAARLAIELDGGQHLADADAYRRDRRKDQLLQENGYFVLRFLAEDVGKCLDLVLDGILRALVHRDVGVPASAGGGDQGRPSPKCAADSVERHVPIAVAASAASK